MSDYRTLKVYGILGLLDDESLNTDALDRNGVERKMYEEQKLRGRLGHLLINSANSRYEFVLVPATPKKDGRFSHKAKYAESFYLIKRKKRKGQS